VSCYVVSENSFHAEKFRVTLLRARNDPGNVWILGRRVIWAAAQTFIATTIAALSFILLALRSIHFAIALGY